VGKTNQQAGDMFLKIKILLRGFTPSFHRRLIYRQLYSPKHTILAH
jgi:hypothetical protein